MKLALAVAALALCLFQTAPSVAQTSGPPIRIGAVPIDSYGQLYFAKDMGFFEQAGLDVQITNFTSGGAITAAVLSGSLDVGGTNTGSLAIAHARGLPVAIIAAGALYNSAAPSVLLVTAKNSPVRSVKDLSGKSIAVTTISDMQQFACEKWIDQHGVDSKSVSFVELPVTEMPVALSTGRIAAAVLLEPVLSQNKDAVRMIGKPQETIANKFLITNWFSTNDWIARNPATEQKFVAVMRKTTAWANSHPKETAAILEKYSKVSREVIMTENRVFYAETPAPAWIQPVIDILAEYKVIPKSFPSTDLIALGGR